MCRRSPASPQGSTPAWSLGREVVQRPTRRNAWKTHLRTLVPGQLRRTAPAKPVPPSETTTSGAGIGSISADRALDVSERAMYQETTRSSLRHMSTTRSRASQIPSTQSTRCHSPSGTGIGQTSQNPAVLRLNDLPCPGISRCEPLDMSHPRNSRSAAASPSLRTVVDAPQPGQRHRCLPADVFPLLFIFAPQDGHFTDFTADLRRRF